MSINDKINKLSEEKNNLNFSLNQAIAELQNLEKQLVGKKEIIENLNKEFYVLNSKLENINSAMFAQSYSLQKVVKYIGDMNNTQIIGPIKSILKFKPEHYSLIASFFGNKLYWFIAETEQDAINAIEQLKTQNLGFATFIIKEKIDRMDFTITPEQHITSFFEYEQKWDKVIKFLFSNLELQQNNILKTDVVVHGGSFVPKEGEEDLYQLETQISLHRELIQKENKELVEINNRYYELISQKNFYEKQLFEIDKNIEMLEKLKSDKESFLKTLDDMLTTLTDQFQRYNTEKKDLLSVIETLNSELTNLDNEEKNLKNSVMKLSEEIGHLQSSSVMDNFLKIVSEYSKLEEQNNNITNEIGIKKSLITENIAKINAVKTEIEEQQSLIEKNKSEIFSQEEKLHQLLNERTLVSEQVNNSQNSLEQKRIDLDNLDSAIKCLNNTKEIVQQQIKSLELQVNTENNNKTNYINWLNDKYNISLEDAKNMYSNIEVDVSQLEKLKKRIESMGAINLAAPEEYVQLEEKYSTLVTQQQDLIKSEQDIKQAISKINEQINTNFKETFAKVKENFQKLCGILFEGGKAELILTNEENMLDTGIDIIVQPPGKKLQNINLLSGGEKSLVALALLFAFFMVKPSPVCILDEADAPLDEANVMRFVKLLKEFSKSTKFILITHITRTMENLDNIYGVTMEELGVSKVISLKLQKEQAEVFS
ncbi:MAG: hypothetical protein SNJ64_03785, partial [Endomicrobiia bacterium]